MVGPESVKKGEHMVHQIPHVSMDSLTSLGHWVHGMYFRVCAYVMGKFVSSNITPTTIDISFGTS